jgi:hypothetical protein
MFLVLHVVIALLSIAYTLYLLFSPSNKGVRLASWLVGLTLASGTMMVISLRTGLIRACFTGLIYLGLNTLGIGIARRKLEASEIQST